MDGLALYAPLVLQVALGVVALAVAFLVIGFFVFSALIRRAGEGLRTMNGDRRLPDVDPMM